MNPTIIIATTNQGKLEEFKVLLPDYNILSNRDIGYEEEIDETGNTLEENALIKAETLFKYTNEAVLAEDSGLFIDALNGEPGIRSARYAGEPTNANNNIELVLDKLKFSQQRKAHFKTVICYKQRHQHHFFEGVVNGVIAEERNGKSGFGYDPIFIPDGYSDTFAALDGAVKHKISHRAMAIQKFLQFLKEVG
jgi:XTP/dITP diphosphohydrolase